MTPATGAVKTRMKSGTASTMPISKSFIESVSSQTGKYGSAMPLTIIGAQKTSAMRTAKNGGAPAVGENPEGDVIGGEPALERCRL